MQLEHTRFRQLEAATVRYQNGPMDMESVSKCFKLLRLLRTTDPSVILRVVHNRLWALGSKHTL